MSLIHQRDPVSWEAMAGLLGRLARDNRYPSVRWIIDLLPSPRPRGPNLMTGARQYKALAQLTGLPVETLARLTLHRFAIRYLTATEVSAVAQITDTFAPLLWEGGPDAPLRGLAHRQVSPSHDKVCPLCWQRVPTLLLPWSLRHVTSCPTHDVLLVDQCSGCGQGLRVDHVTGRCARCHEQEIALLPFISIHDNTASRELTTLIWGAVDDQVDSGILLEGLPHDPTSPLGEMTPAALLRFMWHGAQTLLDRDRGNPIFAAARQLPEEMGIDLPPGLMNADVRTTHGILVSMWTLLRDWSTAWPSLLSHCAEVEEAAEKAGHGRPIHVARALLSTLDDPEFMCIQRAWCSFVEHHMDTEPATTRWYRYYQIIQHRCDEAPSPLVCQEEATRRLGISHLHLGHHLAQGRLRVRRREGARPWLIFDTETLDRCQEERGSLLTLFQAARHVGMSQERLSALVMAGVVPTADGSAPGAPPWFFEPSTLDAALAALVGHVPVRARPSDGDVRILWIGKILAMAEARGLDFPGVLRAIQEGALPAFRCQETCRPRDLWCTREQVLGYFDSLTSASPDVATRRLSSIQVRHRLGCSWRTLRLWRLAGLLVPCETDFPSERRHWYESRDVIAFEQRYLTLEAAAALVGCAGRDVNRRVRLGQYPDALVYRAHKDAYLFDKATLTHQVETWIDANEAAHILGISISGFNALVRDGYISPIVTTSGGRRRYDRGDIAQLRRNDREDTRIGMGGLGDAPDGGTVSAREAADILGIGLQTLRKWTKSGRITPVEEKWSGLFAIEDVLPLCRTPPPAHITRQYRGKLMRSSQIVQALGLVHQTFTRWVNAGRVTPRARSRPYARIYARADIVRLSEQRQRPRLCAS